MSQSAAAFEREIKSFFTPSSGMSRLKAEQVAMKLADLNPEFKFYGEVQNKSDQMNKGHLERRRNRAAKEILLIRLDAEETYKANPKGVNNLYRKQLAHYVDQYTRLSRIRSLDQRVARLLPEVMRWKSEIAKGTRLTNADDVARNTSLVSAQQARDEEIRNFRKSNKVAGRGSLKTVSIDFEKLPSKVAAYQAGAKYGTSSRAATVQTIDRIKQGPMLEPLIGIAQ